jgi:hypothetical protein
MMATEQRHGYSTGDLLRAYPLLAAWQIRTAIDGLGVARIPRVGRNRLLPAEMLTEFEAEVSRRGWLHDEHAVSQMIGEGCPNGHDTNHTED